MLELTPDQKGIASITLGDVIVRTRENFPDPKYQPQVFAEKGQYHIYGIDPNPHSIWVTADGIGTKPELAERLYASTGDPQHFRTLAFDTLAMIESDEARFGRILLGIANIIDLNNADQKIVAELAKGLFEACTKGRFALLNGETAELGYRTSGWGETRLNWNAVGVSIVVPDKLILGTDLAPEQPIVAFREHGIRSNGLTKARAILEAAYLHAHSYPSKKEYFRSNLANYLDVLAVNGNDIRNLLDLDIYSILSTLSGHDIEEQILLPWHKSFPTITKELLRPATLYGKVINEAQGWVNGAKQVDLIAAAHISGGGIPEKVKRMVEPKGLGAHIDAIFPDPSGIQLLMELADTLPEEQRNRLISQRTASQQWNRGIGFVVVTRTNADARRMIEIANEQGYEAAIAGEILNEPNIEWRGETWTY